MQTFGVVLERNVNDLLAKGGVVNGIAFNPTDGGVYVGVTMPGGGRGGGGGGGPRRNTRRNTRRA